MNTLRTRGHALLGIGLLLLVGCGKRYPDVEAPEHPGPKPTAPPVTFGAAPKTPRGVKPPQTTTRANTESR